MIAQLPRKLLFIGVLSIVVLTVVALAAVPTMVAE